MERIAASAPSSLTWTARAVPEAGRRRRRSGGEVMPGRRLFILAAAAVALSAFGQTPSNWTPPRTGDGQPDLSGYWTNVTLTPLQRPENLANKPFFTPAEAAAYEKATIAQNNADNRAAIKGTDVDLGRPTTISGGIAEPRSSPRCERPSSSILRMARFHL